jgi:hypothetical protein
MKAQLIREDASPSSMHLLLDREATAIVSAALSFAGRFHPDYKALADRIESELIKGQSQNTVEHKSA